MVLVSVSSASALFGWCRMDVNVEERIVNDTTGIKVDAAIHRRFCLIGRVVVVAVWKRHLRRSKGGKRSLSLSYFPAFPKESVLISLQQLECLLVLIVNRLVTIDQSGRTGLLRQNSLLVNFNYIMSHV
jgi:hypothetical protein